jgi:hypothetical protein
MPRLCTVCSSPEREAINEALVAGEVYRGIARRFAVSEDALARHRKDHIPTALTKAVEAKEVATAGDLLAQIQDLQQRAMAMLTRAEETEDTRAQCAAHRECRGHLELLAKLLGELRESSVSITVGTSSDSDILARLIDAGLCAECRMKIVAMERAITGEWNGGVR